MPPSLVVHVIDDDDAVRDALAELLEAEGIVAHVHASASEFLDKVSSLDRGCVVTDVRMPEMSGLELLRELQARSLNLPVIVLSGEADVAMAVEALKNGAAEFIEKPFDDEAILAAVRKALARLELDDEAATKRAQNTKRLDSLTGRETDVLAGLVAGHSNKVIGLDLGISPRTVEVYRSNLMFKMRAASLSELVRLALYAPAPT
jgi:two-component system, LuxR family, response regulator FixJ